MQFAICYKFVEFLDLFYLLYDSIKVYKWLTTLLLKQLPKGLFEQVNETLLNSKNLVQKSLEEINSCETIVEIAGQSHISMNITAQSVEKYPNLCIESMYT